MKGYANYNSIKSFFSENILAWYHFKNTFFKILRKYKSHSLFEKGDKQK